MYYAEPNSQYAMVFVPLSPSLGVLIKPDFNVDRPTIDDVKNYKHPEDDYAHPKKSFVNKLNKLTTKSAENVVLHAAAEEQWVEKLVSSYKDWKVENQTFELPHENGIILINIQKACKKCITKTSTKTCVSRASFRCL